MHVVHFWGGIHKANNLDDSNHGVEASCRLPDLRKDVKAGIACGAGGIFPAFTMASGTIQYNFGEEPFKFSPPWDARG